MGKPCHTSLEAKGLVTRRSFFTFASLYLLFLVWVINLCVSSSFAAAAAEEPYTNLPLEQITTQFRGPSIDFNSLSFGNPRLYIMISLVLVGSILAAASGIGRGGIFVSILFYFGNYGIKEAIPISKGLIFASAVIAFYINCGEVHPQDGGPVVNLNVMKILVPGALAGSSIGVFLNQKVPDLAIVIGLVVFISLTFFITLYKGLRKFQQETIEGKLPPFNEIPLTNVSFTIPLTLDAYEFYTIRNTAKSSKETRHTATETNPFANAKDGSCRSLSPTPSEGDDDYTFTSYSGRKFKQTGVHSTPPPARKAFKTNAEKNQKTGKVNFTVAPVADAPQVRNTASSVENGIDENPKPPKSTHDKKLRVWKPRLYTPKSAATYSTTSASHANGSESRMLNFSTPSTQSHISSMFSWRRRDNVLSTTISRGVPEISSPNDDTPSSSTNKFSQNNEFFPPSNDSASMRNGFRLNEENGEIESGAGESFTHLNLTSSWASLDLAGSIKSSSSVPTNLQVLGNRRMFHSSVPNPLVAYSLLQFAIFLVILFSFSVACGVIITSSALMAPEALAAIGVTIVFALLVQLIFLIDILRSNPQVSGLSLWEVLGNLFSRDRFQFNAINYLFPSSRDLDSSLIASSNFNIFGQGKSKLIPFAAFIGAALAGLLGIDSSLIITPMLLWAEYDPTVAIASSSTCLLLTAPSIMLQFLLLNLLSIPETILFGLVALVGNVIGAQLVFFVSKRYKRRSYLIFSVSFAAVTAIVFLVLKFFVF
ncbi:hypothetical protein IE077_000065 [Cardiosporidium cionae]|uniref:Membrane transporter protein n=1 Tax=Cardiosporidium cionae TaxID=476202 RepID=A0ABQ7J645_9APIC|nr:hypothetical protein IE077_000065 [Cardiosporidium cionae]|eukprot:KAF8819423.1 hypothetical protein IE077_000065 [Cardiosporidium cionae]